MRLKTTIIILILALFIFNVSAFAAGVKPLVVDIDAQPGDTKQFKLKLTPGSEEEKVKFSFYQPVQLTNGSLTYQKAKKENFPAVDWLKLDKKEVTVYPGEKTTVSGMVEVPFGAAGSNTVVIMVEPQKPSQQKGGVKFMVRYAVRVNIRVDKPGIRSEAKLTKFKLTSDKENKPQIKALISNSSKLDYLVSGEATLRDSERRLVERVTLKSPKGNKAKSDKTRMYPGSKVKYLGDISKRLGPGKYNLRVFFKYADHGQIIEEKTIQVKKGQFDFPSIAEIGAFTIEPKQIDLKLSPGEHKSKVIRLNSQIGNDAKVVATTSNIKQDYNYSLVDWIKLRGRTNFQLRARKKGQVILTTAVPKEVSKGSYHGNIVLKAFNPQTEKLLSKKEVPMSVLVGEDHDYKVKVKSLYTKQVEEGQLLSLDLYNTGKTFVQPQAKAIIKNTKDKFVERVQLSIPQENKQILPLTSKRLRGVAEKLKPGSYKAEITIQQKGAEIKKVTKEFKVKK